MSFISTQKFTRVSHQRRLETLIERDRRLVALYNLITTWFGEELNTGYWYSCEECWNRSGVEVMDKRLQLGLTVGQDT